ncbi:MAG: voltage-gated potassium channel [Betaproteobacteria bacterium ADurb.Bin341]|nr:MAG: voltage-gated potassium channel [Betaproteobacteria bacterium ADurb.Bin341]
MGDILLLTLRRLRVPLIALIVSYAISVLGLSLMPANPVPGQPGHMSLFHAFYVISYTATTIGFGEVPREFSDAQRAWVTFSIYLSVTAWAYALGSIFALARDSTFRTAVANSRFASRVRHLGEPFYIIAGYGQSGNALAHAFDDLGLRSVIIELQDDRAAQAEVEDYSTPPLFIAADARWPDVLCDAGALHPQCQAVIVLVSDDEVAQAIAIGVTIMRPDLTVLARIYDKGSAVNLEDFPNIAVIDPFEAFALNLELNIASPAVLWVEEWLSSAPGDPCPKPASTPGGHWLIFGFGRFGRAIAEALERSGSTWSAFDSNSSLAQHPHLQITDNSGQSLREAGIGRAVGIVAGTDRDAMNLALVTRARKLNPKLSVLIRQNHTTDRSLIAAAHADLAFVKSEVIVRECLQLLISPLLNRFLLMVRHRGKAVAEEIITRLLIELDERVPSIWVFDCNASHPGLKEVLTNPGEDPLRLSELGIDPLDPPNRLRAVPLLLSRGDTSDMLPEGNTILQDGDQILFAGAYGVRERQSAFLRDPSPVDFVRTGFEAPRSWLFRKLRGMVRGKSS